MTPEKFKSIVKNVSDVFQIDDKEIFTPSRQKPKVDARHIIYLLCKSRHGMPIVYIQRYMNEQYKFNVHHATIKHGIDKAQSLVDVDHLNLAVFE